ncbi:GNAT family N-acetyltransferase [Streptomyces sp. NPDC093252]|uniref:GNAT family N-acetyltransferase n=1 Tax=Streptomyces sp. NPDC093252 TaxID=3154980 RepID=UPI003444E367
MNRARVDIAVCRAADLPALDRCLGTPGAASFHAPRFARQEAGESTYLVARLDGDPAGHAEIRWRGCAAPEVPVGCPEINGLGVRDGLRSRGIGTALIHRAEDLVRERGLTVVGLGVGDGNPRAAALYARLGYRPLIAYVDRYAYRQRDGTTVECADPCLFLTKDLT